MPADEQEVGRARELLAGAGPGGAAARGHLARRAVAFAVLAVGLALALTALLPNVWVRMLVAHALLVPLALRLQPQPWRALLALRPQGLLLGLGAGLLLYLAGAAVYALLGSLAPTLAAETVQLYAWRDLLPAAWLGPPLALLIALAEEIVWRGAVALPLAARLGLLPGCLLAALAFAAAHLAFGSALLVLAALGLGLAWGLLAVGTRSLAAAAACHALWDLLVLFWRPY